MLIRLLSLFAHAWRLMLGIATPQKFPPPLGADEENTLFLKAAGGDAEARGEIILHNLRLVSHIIRKYYGSSRMQEDLFSIGAIGLTKAVDTFRPDAGTKFATYAARCIQNEILMFFRSRKKLSAEVSIHETIDTDKDGNPLTYMDVIGSEESLEDEVDLAMQSAKVRKLVSLVLSERERQIIVMRYGLGENEAMTQHAVAQKLGISRSYVSRIEKAALEKLREGMLMHTETSFGT